MTCRVHKILRRLYYKLRYMLAPRLFKRRTIKFQTGDFAISGNRMEGYTHERIINPDWPYEREYVVYIDPYTELCYTYDYTHIFYIFSHRKVRR